MFAILANFGNENAVSVITKITSSILENAKGELEKGRRKNQLCMLAQLRTLVSTNIEIMEQVSSFFKVENDIFYKVGEEKDAQNKSYEVVKNLLAANQFTITEIKNFANVSEEFVLEVQKSLK